MNETLDETRLSSNASQLFLRPSHERPKCYTAVAWRVYLSKEQSLILSICYGSTILPVIILNTILCVRLYKHGHWQKPSKFLIFMLSFSDALMGFVSIPSTIVICTLYSHQRHCFIERAVVFFGQTNGHFSFYITLTIAMQRYSKMHWKLVDKYHLIRKTFTKPGLNLIITLLFFLSCLHGVVSTYFFGLIESSVPNIMMMALRSSVLFITQLCYFRVYASLKRHSETMRTGNPKRSDDTSDKCTRKLPIKSACSKVNRSVLVIMIILTLSFTPAMVADMWTGYYTFIQGTASPMLPRFFFYLSFTTIFLNCASNAAVIIYQSFSSLTRVSPK